MSMLPVQTALGINLAQHGKLCNPAHPSNTNEKHVIINADTTTNAQLCALVQERLGTKLHITIERYPDSITYMKCSEAVTLIHVSQSEGWKHESWDIETPLTEWQDCTFDDAGHLTRLKVTNNTKVLSCGMFEHLQTLYCYSNQLQSLSDLPQSLTKLFLSKNQLQSLPDLPQSLTYLYCYHNQLQSLPDLPQSLTELFCPNNQLQSLPDLPQSLKILSCNGNQLESLPDLPQSLKGPLLL